MVRHCRADMGFHPADHVYAALFSNGITAGCLRHDKKVLPWSYKYGSLMTLTAHNTTLPRETSEWRLTDFDVMKLMEPEGDKAEFGIILEEGNAGGGVIRARRDHRRAGSWKRCGW